MHIIYTFKYLAKIEPAPFMVYAPLIYFILVISFDIPFLWHVLCYVLMAM